MNSKFIETVDTGTIVGSDIFNRQTVEDLIFNVYWCIFLDEKVVKVPENVNYHIH